MLPLAAGITLDHKDEASGVTYKFGYLTGDRGDAFMVLQKQMGTLQAAHLQKATEIIDKEHAGKKWEKGERIKAIAAKATSMADDSVERDPAQDVKFSRQLVDMFLVGWEGGPKDMPKFPADGKPSARFKFGDLIELGTIVTEKIPELTGINTDEAKN